MGCPCVTIRICKIQNITCFQNYEAMKSLHYWSMEISTITLEVIMEQLTNQIKFFIFVPVNMKHLPTQTPTYLKLMTNLFLITQY